MPQKKKFSLFAGCLHHLEKFALRDARLTGPAGSDMLYIATTDLVDPTKRWDTVRAYSQVGGYDKAYLTGTTGDDTFTAIGMPHAAAGLPLGMIAGMTRLVGTGYFLQTQSFEEVYANVLTGNRDVANLYDSDGAGTDTFWGSLADAVLSDGTLDLTNGDLLAAASYYYRAYGFDNTGGTNPTKDTVNLFGSSTGGTNYKKVILPLDYGAGECETGSALRRPGEGA